MDTIGHKENDTKQNKINLQQSLLLLKKKLNINLTVYHL